MIEPLVYRAYLLQDAAKPATDAAQGQPAPEAPPQPPPAWTSLVPLVVIFVLFWFILIRPQRKQQKERDNMLGQLAKNDHVVTTGGIYGIIVRIDEREAVLKIDENKDIRIRVARSAIAGVEKSAGTRDDAEVAQDAGPSKK